MKQSEILPGDVLFLYGEGFIKSAIEFVTHGAYHCAIFYDNETLVEAQGGRETGVVALSDYLHNGDRLEVWRDITLTDEERNEVATYALHHSGIKYDYKGIWEELIHYELGVSIDDYNEGQRRICSSFVAECAIKSVKHNWVNIKHVPAPKDLQVSGKLTHIGNLE